MPDDRLGDMVVALVEPAAGAEVDEADVIAHVKQHLASYKAPRRVLVTDSVGRADNGKIDYRRHKAEAAARLGVATL